MSPAAAAAGVALRISTSPLAMRTERVSGRLCLRLGDPPSRSHERSARAAPMLDRLAMWARYDSPLLPGLTKLDLRRLPFAARTGFCVRAEE